MLLTVHMSPVEMELLPLLCLCLLTVSGTTFADGNNLQIIKVTEGSDATLPCSTSNKKDITSQSIEWRKDGQKQVFLYETQPLPGQDQQFTGRVSLYTSELQHGNASIEIKNTKLSDSGNYTCEIGKLQTNQKLHIQLLVDPVVVKVKEGDDVILPCSTKGSVSSQRIEWKTEDKKTVFLYEGTVWGQQDDKFIDRVSLFDGELKNGNASIKIKNTEVSDSGNYTCEFSHLNQIFHIKLLVGGELKDRTEEKIQGASPEPSVKLLEQTKDWAQLQCLVRGAFPQPNLQWQNSSGNIVPAQEPQVTKRGGGYDVILQTTVNKTDYYRCVATQKEINHRIHAETHVYIHGERSVGSSSTVVIPWIINVLFFLFLVETV